MNEYLIIAHGCSTGDWIGKSFIVPKNCYLYFYTQHGAPLDKDYARQICKQPSCFESYKFSENMTCVNYLFIGGISNDMHIALGLYRRQENSWELIYPFPIEKGVSLHSVLTELQSHDRGIIKMFVVSCRVQNDIFRNGPIFHDYSDFRTRMIIENENIYFNKY